MSASSLQSPVSRPSSSSDLVTPDNLRTEEGQVKLSATRLRTYLLCPRQFRYRYVDELPQPFTGALAFGQVIHRVIHDLHQWSIYTGDPLNEGLALSSFDQFWEQILSEREPQFKSDVEAGEYAQLAEIILLGYIEAHREKPQPFLLEFPFEIPLRDEYFGHAYVLSGIIDRLDQEEDGLVVVDFKSGKRKPSQRDLASDIQLSVYAFAAQYVFGQEVKEVILYHLRDQTPFAARRGDEQIRHLVEYLMPQVVRSIVSQKFSPHVGYWCNFCPFKERCYLEGPEIPT